MKKELQSSSNVPSDLSNFINEEPLPMLNKDIISRPADSDSRSVTSEYDYANKKKFTEILTSPKNWNSRLNQMLIDQNSPSES